VGHVAWYGLLDESWMAKMIIGESPISPPMGGDPNPPFLRAIAAGIGHVFISRLRVLI
jgi:hypothetical protein